jgi:DNA repair exonuclease SbcCD nuclease subunit
MKVLHTADIHLRKANDERWFALSKLIEVGKEQKVDLFVISGDLFDKDIDAEKLRSKIRTLFSGNGFKVIIIPGNHDKESYRGGLHFGSDTVILNEFGRCFDHKGIKIIGLPFEEIGEEEMHRRIYALKEKLSAEKKNIVVCHGELLDIYFSRRDFGDEGEARYMPFKLSHFSDLNVSYVLAGHFHTHFDVRSLDNGGYFVYPGSPVSITRREINQRKANLFVVGKEPKEFPLDTPYFEEVTIELYPLGREKAIDVIKNRIKNIPPNAKPIINIRGFFNGIRENTNEGKLIREIEKIIPRNAELNPPEIRDVRTILDDDLFKGFLNKLDGLDFEEEKKKQMVEIAIEAMAEAKK